MPLRQSSAYALRCYPLAEADLVVVFYTLGFGRLRAVARGARRLQSRFGSAFQSLTRSRLSWYEREGQELARVSSCEVERSYFVALGSPEAAATAAYVAELVQEFTPERDANPSIFRLIGAVMDAVARGLPLGLAARYFEVWILKLSGLLPQLHRCGVCGGPLGPGRWVEPRRLEFACHRCRAGGGGGRWLSPAATALLEEILRHPPLRVARGAGKDVRALQRLAAVNRMLLQGHLERELRSWRYLEEMRRRGRRRPPAAGPPAAAPVG